MSSRGQTTTEHHACCTLSAALVPMLAQTTLIWLLLVVQLPLTVFLLAIFKPFQNTPLAPVRPQLSLQCLELARPRPRGCQEGRLEKRALQRRSASPMRGTGEAVEAMAWAGGAGSALCGTVHADALVVIFVFVVDIVVVVG